MPSDIAIKIRRGTNAQWIAANPILAAGELGLNTDNNRLKVGNGSLAWNSLSYINISPGDVNEATQDYIGAFLQNGTHDGINVSYNDTLNTVSLVVDRNYIVDKSTAQSLTNKTIINSINSQTTSSYILSLSDASKVVSIDNTSSSTITVPLNSSVAFQVGTKIEVLQKGIGQVTISPAVGVSINSANGLKLKSTWSLAHLLKIGINEWVLSGDTSV